MKEFKISGNTVEIKLTTQNGATLSAERFENVVNKFATCAAFSINLDVLGIDGNSPIVTSNV